MSYLILIGLILVLCLVFGYMLLQIINIIQIHTDKRTEKQKKTLVHFSNILYVLCVVIIILLLVIHVFF